MSAEVLRATKVRIYPTQERAEFLMAKFGGVRITRFYQIAIITCTVSMMSH
ncbi:helix-turn-helix domain-containing protein [Vibrio sp. B172a]|uniref:helix-turn-helix domain-containing protein n=1 Tax=Vibrio sp. B172a TaxID=2835790 RepID=UPI0025618A87|nr:helix-turn-helix domain-containing protein [Vibrio sp. B172a]